MKTLRRIVSWDHLVALLPAVALGPVVLRPSRPLLGVDLHHPAAAARLHLRVERRHLLRVLQVRGHRLPADKKEAGSVSAGCPEETWPVRVWLCTYPLHPRRPRVHLCQAEVQILAALHPPDVEVAVEGHVDKAAGGGEGGAA